MTRVLMGFVACAIWAAPLAAAAAEPASLPVASPDIRAIPPILDDAYRHRHHLQLELVPFGGTYLGRSMGSTFLTGGRLWLHLDPAWAVGVQYGYSRVGGSTALQAAASEPDVHMLDAETALSNPVAMRLGSILVEMDLYLTVGVGAILLDRRWDAYGLVGGGVRFYTGLSWLAIRIDVDSHIHRTRFPGTNRIDVDLSLALGVSFLFPTNPSPYER
jgi:outer membrane beta-barrel protein